MTTKIKVIAFDLFGTVFDPSGVPIEEKREYVRQFTNKEFSPMKLPYSWREIPAFPDSKEGIELLRSRYKVITCSNWDYSTTCGALYHSNIRVDGIIQLSEIRCYKPKLAAYAHICDAFLVEPSEVLFITGNKGGPDNTGAPEKIGMRTILIRHGWPNTITELAGEMGC